MAISLRPYVWLRTWPPGAATCGGSSGVAEQYRRAPVAFAAESDDQLGVAVLEVAGVAAR
jgi:hypothetical protein